MCGIIGHIAFAGRTAGEQEESTVRRLLTLMARRGPDDEGLWRDGQHCILGFRRLTVLDLSPTGHQPMLTQDGRYVLVYNGEVYNFRELRRELEHNGVRFRSTGDTEVVLYALAEWGTEALSRFNGMFALGFYDTQEKRLLLARDHAGIKPLYYLLMSQGLVFASQYDQILAHPWRQHLDVSADALALYLRLGYIPAPYALLQNSHLFEPGTWLEFSHEGQVRHGRFFEFSAYREPDLRGEEAYAAVDAAVTAAVRRQMVSDVPVGTFLSGGIDSPLVAAKMRAVSNSVVRAFSLGTYEGDRDESSDAIAYARELGVEHTVERVTPGQALDMLDDVVAACGEPFAESSIFPTLMVSLLARQQVKVVISGDGGDELFWGYVQRLVSVLGPITNLRQRSESPEVRWNMKKLFTVSALHRDARWPSSLGDYYRLKHIVSEGWLQRIFPDLPVWPTEFSLFTYTSWQPDRTAQWLRWNEFVGYLPKLLLKVDRASMYQSLEVRVPLLDREVVEVAMRIDWRSCLDMERMIGKLPLRDVLARHVRHQTQAKRGFSVPIGAWFRGPLRSIFEEAVLERGEILGLPLAQKATRELFDRHLSGQVNFGRILWTLLSLSLWQNTQYQTRHTVH